MSPLEALQILGLKPGRTYSARQLEETVTQTERRELAVFRHPGGDLERHEQARKSLSLVSEAGRVLRAEVKNGKLLVKGQRARSSASQRAASGKSVARRTVHSAAASAVARSSAATRAAPGFPGAAAMLKTALIALRDLLVVTWWLLTCPVRFLVERKLMRADLFSDLTLPKAERFLLDVRREGAAKKTVNDYSSALKQFTSWLSVTKGWTDPLAGLSRLKGEDDVRVRRMALTPAQLQRLFEAAERRSVERYLEGHSNARPETVQRFRCCGLERAMIYRLGALAGLRVNEIRTLTWGCLDLDSDPPTLTVEARYAKSRRRDTVPLNSGLAAALRDWREERTSDLGRPPKGDERVVKVPRHLTDEQFRKDCAFAGIPLRDDTGAVLDLYAATRHTFCTLLGKAGIAPHRQRLLARHADLSTTLKYTHFQVIDLVEGIEALPDLTAAEGVERADYLRNAGCSQAQSDARECNEEGVGADTSAEAEGNVKGLPVQDLASPSKAMREVSNSLPRNELWWRRRESNPRPENIPPRSLRT